MKQPVSERGPASGSACYQEGANSGFPSGGQQLQNPVGDVLKRVEKRQELGTMKTSEPSHSIVFFICLLNVLKNMLEKFANIFQMRIIQVRNPLRFWLNILISSSLFIENNIVVDMGRNDNCSHQAHSKCVNNNLKHSKIIEK